MASTPPISYPRLQTTSPLRSTAALTCTDAVVTADNRALPEPSPRSAAQASIASPPPDRDGGTPDWNVRTPASRRRSRCRITSPARTELPGDYGISHERGRSVATFAQGPRPCRRPSTTASSDAWESRGALGRVELLRILRRLGICSSPWRTGRLGSPGRLGVPRRLGRVELLRILRRLGSCSSPWRNWAASVRPDRLGAARRGGLT